MSSSSDLGHFVWHDLMTGDVAKARRFYADLFGWDYHVEHAADFTWKDGEADYPLIVAAGEAHGGFVDLGKSGSSQWLGYVAVNNVDAAAIRAATLGGRIDRQAFDVPGVGRSAVIRDPQGAVICPYVASHNYPAPRNQFLRDLLITDDIEAAKTFYTGLFGWTVQEAEDDGSAKRAFFVSADGSVVASIAESGPDSALPDGWVPCFGCGDIDKSVTKAETLGAKLLKSSAGGLDDPCAVLSDPDGAAFGFVATGGK